jgi:FtsP/CotA-like multicopper oxidase with cupredoxin domain
LKSEVFALEADQNHRLRFINAGAFAEFQVQIDEHDFAITEVDGTDVSAINNARFHRMNILPAQRYSIILTANASSTSNSFWMRARLVTHCFGEENPYMQEEVRAIVQYASQNSISSVQSIPTSKDWPEIIELECRDLNTSLLFPVVPSPAPLSADATIYLRSNFEIGPWRLSRGFLNQSSWRPNIRSPSLHRILDGLQNGNASFDLVSSTTNDRSGVNNIAFDVRTELVYQTSGIQVLDIIVSNFDDGAHPFHLHGAKFWVLTGGQGYPPSSWMGGIPEDAGLDLVHAMRRDTATVEAFGWVVLRVVADNPGVWAFHCHISWHLEAGLMMQFWMRSDEMKAWNLPEANRRLCEMAGIEKGAGPGDYIWFGDSG